jgi:AraC-like DNA-binding protein
MNDELLAIEEPENYYVGVGESQLPTPTEVLFYLRKSQDTLQQEALQNRSHHRAVLAFNLKTSGQIHVDNLALPFSPGQALLILPYQFHHFSQLASTQLKWLFCTFEMQSKTFLEPLRNRVIDISEKTDHALGELLGEWHSDRSSLQAEQLQTVLLRLLISLKQDRQTTTSQPPESEDSLIRAINRLMVGWRGRTIVVDDLAKAIGLSGSRLRFLFKEAAGIPLGSYIQNYRINRAMNMLQTTSLSISDISEDAGFGSPQAFSRIFKNKVGQTPRSYRVLRYSKAG